MKYLLLFAALLAISDLNAQDEMAKNKIGLHYGLHFFARQDQLFSPMIYHSTSPLNLNLNYANEKSKKIHWAEAEFTLYDASWHDPYDYQTGFDSIKTQTTLPTGYTVVTARYAYLRHLATNSLGEWWLGGMNDNQINSIDNQYGPFATFGYFAHFSLAPVAYWKAQLTDRSGLDASVWFSIFSWVARSPYAVNDDEYILNIQSHNGFKTFFNYLGDGDVHLINHLQQFNLNLGYTYSFPLHWNIGAEYRFEFLRDSEPETLISYQNFINLKASYVF